MALPMEALATLDNLALKETWIKCLAALTKVKKLKGEKPAKKRMKSPTYF